MTALRHHQQLRHFTLYGAHGLLHDAIVDPGAAGLLVFCRR